MKAVILVGGEGTRLRPLTCNTPKAMLPVLNKPFLEHMIRYLRGHGVDEIIFAFSLCWESRAQASCKVLGARYSNLGNGIFPFLLLRFL